MDEGDDVSTIPNNYGTAATLYTFDTDGRRRHAEGDTGNKTAANKLFVYSLADDQPVFNADNKETDSGTAKCPDR